MKPYYEHKGVTLYHADCAEVLPILPRVDLVITDPPYGMQFQSGKRHVKKYAKIIGDDELPVGLIAQAIAKADRAAYVFCRWDNLRDMPKPKSVIVWVKNNQSGSGDLFHEHARQWEAICFYPLLHHKFRKRPADVLFCDRTGNVHHPTEKPLVLLQQLMRFNEGETVLDPFAGSGSTLLAAKLMGLTTIGIEIDEGYCEQAAERLSQGVFDFGE